LDDDPGNPGVCPLWQVPDVDVMMETFDHPRVDKYQWEANLDPPPLLKYCSTPNHWDITWPDWSFWGW
jgi:hypothetical protein